MKIKKDTIEEALERESLPVKAIERIEDVCIHVVDNTGKIVCYSKGCEKIENMKHEDVIGKDSHTLYNYVENESMQDYVLKTGKKVQDVHVKYESPSGKLADVISSTYPIFSADGQKNVEAAICIYRDISDYMHMAKTIDKLQNDLKNQQLKDNGTQFTFKDVVGSSVATLECVRQGKIAAQTNAPILLAGPTGTGKEVFAQSIHNDSSRAHNPFVAINCSAIPENLLESTLFGTVKGSFTGAVDAKGLLETARGGTLFLDEINSMNMTLQSKLLRVLETKRYRKVGGNKELDMDVRVLSALNQDPLEAVDEGRSDIMELVQSFLSSEAVAMGKSLYQVSDEAADILLGHDWPGNIRELKHTVTHAIYMAQYQDTVLTTDLLPSYIKKNHTEKKLHDKFLADRENDSDLKSTLNRIEKQILNEVLINNDFNISKSAKELGISRQNLQYKLKVYQIKQNG